MTRNMVLAFAAAASLMLFGSPAHAVSLTIAVDENGNGFVTSPTGVTASLASSLATDPGPGGQASALTYNFGLLPLSITPGDVLMSEPGGPVGAISDVVRFNGAPFVGTSTLVFYSNGLDGVDSLADTASPTAFYANNVLIPELGSEGNNGAIYTPSFGQPGFSSFAAITYDFISDGSAVPIPAALPLFATGLGGLGLLGWRRKRKAQAIA